MNRDTTRWLIIVAGAAVMGLILVCIVAIILWSATGITTRSRYSANGEQIYFTATSQRGTPITPDITVGMGIMRRGGMACATCHGPDGRGGRTRMMMSSVEAPDIRYKTLTAEKHGSEMDHEPYTDETIKQAITQGIEPNGKQLKWPMPRWSMSEDDLNDLLTGLFENARLTQARSLGKHL